MVHIARVTE